MIEGVTTELPPEHADLIPIDGMDMHMCGNRDTGEVLIGIRFWAAGEPLASIHWDLEEAEQFLSLLAERIAEMRKRIGVKLS